MLLVQCKKPMATLLMDEELEKPCEIGMKKSENLMKDQKFRQEAWNSLCQSEFPSHCTKGKLLFVKPRIISVQFLSVSALGLTKYLGASL